MTVNGAVSYLHSDHLGTVSAVTSVQGTTIARTLTLPFGAVRWTSGISPTDFGFTGQKLDATGLMYFKARYYAPGIGRFVSADTIVPEPREPKQFNHYAYTLNNPLRYVDPTGHFTEDQLKKYFGDDWLDGWSKHDSDFLQAFRSADFGFGDILATELGMFMIARDEESGQAMLWDIDMREVSVLTENSLQPGGEWAWFNSNERYSLGNYSLEGSSSDFARVSLPDFPADWGWPKQDHKYYEGFHIGAVWKWDKDAAYFYLFVFSASALWAMAPAGASLISEIAKAAGRVGLVASTAQTVRSLVRSTEAVGYTSQASSPLFNHELCMSISQLWK